VPWPALLSPEDIIAGRRRLSPHLMDRPING
jgi:hypothetical protein